MSQIRLFFFFLFLTLLFTTATLPKTTDSLSLFQLKTILSLSQSTLTRIANLRAARGDFSGSERAKLIAGKIGGRWLGLGFWWNYLINFSSKDFDEDGEFMGAVLDANELIRVLGELTLDDSGVRRASWKHQNVQVAAKRLLNRLLNVFHVSGALKQVVETLQEEVMEGELFKDCLEVGGDDLKGLVRILKDMASQFRPTTGSNSWRDL